MKKYNIHILLIFAILFLQSCKKVINLNVEEKEKKIVLNSILQNDEKIVLNLTKSKSIIDDTDLEYIDNATIVLTENGTPITSKNYTGNGSYTFNHIAKKGNTYKIEISNGNLQTIKAETSILNPNLFDIIDTSSTKYYDENYLSIKMKILNTDENSYYFLECLNENGDNIYTESMDLKVEENYWGEYLLFNNLISGGGDIDFQFITPKYYYDDMGSNGSTNSTIYIILHRVDKALYNYELSIYLQNSTSEDPFAEAVQVYNNIENGFGIFGSESYSVDSIEIK